MPDFRITTDLRSGFSFFIDPTSILSAVLTFMFTWWLFFDTEKLLWEQALDYDDRFDICVLICRES